MKRQTTIIVILALLLPALVRGLWFYRGIPAARPEISTPDYASFARPQTDINTPNTEDVKQLGGKVLLDAYHGNQFMLNEIDSLTSAIQTRGGKIETITDAASLEIQLKTASAFITISPSVVFSPIEDQLLKNFTDRGGKVLVFADATRIALYYDYISGNPIAAGDSNAANSLLKLFDITIKNDYLYNTQKNEGNFRNVLFDEFGKNELTFGLSEVALYGARSVESPSGLILFKGPESNLSSLDDANDPNSGGAALNADGNVAAFGDFTFLASPYNTYTDNATLIQNIADFALSGKQAASLDLFPFVFTQQTIQVYIASDVDRTSSLVTALGSLQSSMNYQNLKLEFVDEVPTTGDAILMGSFDSTDDFDSYLKKADVEIDSDLINTVALGDFDRAGNATILFNQGKKGNTLVLLADTPDDLIALIGVVGYGSLSSCLTSPDVAICSVGYGDSSYDYSEDTGETTTETPSDSTDPAAEATPTPSG